MKAFATLSISLFLVALICQPVSAQSPQISTDKSTYLLGEKIKVSFSGSPGEKKDWICISPTSLPDNHAGDYDYIPQGTTQGVMTFNAPSPGKYEARAYYNYSRNGYVVSARCGFSVVGSEGGQNPHMERKIDSNNPNEAQLPLDKGLVYILNGSIRMIADREIQVKVDGKPIVWLSPGQYFVYPSSAGTVLFTTDTYIEYNPPGQKVESKATSPGKVAVEVKPGHAYYLSLRAAPMGLWSPTLEWINHEEGANSIRTDKMILVK
jgi:hypothetical protein